MAPQDITQLEERMVEEVRRYEHLYNPTHKEYKNVNMSWTSWREISGNVGLELKDCKEKWRTMRDRFMRLKKTLKGRSGDAGGNKTVPAFYILMSFLEPHVKHRETSSNFKKVSPAAQDNVPATPEAATPPAGLPSASSSSTASSAPAVSPLLPSVPDTPTAEGRPLGPSTVSRSLLPVLQSPSVPPPSSSKRKRQQDTEESLTALYEEAQDQVREALAMMPKQGEYDRVMGGMADTLLLIPVERRAQVVSDMMRVLTAHLSGKDCCFSVV